MKTNVTTKAITFDFIGIIEEEAIILRSLLNLSEKGVRNKLNQDKEYWNNILDEEEAVKIGIGLCNQIMTVVDDKRSG